MKEEELGVQAAQVLGSWGVIGAVKLKKRSVHFGKHLIFVFDASPTSFLMMIVTPAQDIYYANLGSPVVITVRTNEQFDKWV